jgi:hypothetical protein
LGLVGQDGLLGGEPLTYGVLRVGCDQQAREQSHEGSEDDQTPAVHGHRDRIGRRAAPSELVRAQRNPLGQRAGLTLAQLQRGGQRVAGSEAAVGGAGGDQPRDAQDEGPDRQEGHGGQRQDHRGSVGPRPRTQPARQGDTAGDDQDAGSE